MREGIGTTLSIDESDEAMPHAHHRVTRTAPAGYKLTLAGVVMIVVVVTGLASHAQRPERQQEVKVPGIEVSLKVGWQLLFHDGCRFAVPGSWRPDADVSFVRAPDGSNLSVRMFKIASWSAHKAQIKAAFGHVTVVHEDTERRLWFEIGEKPRVQHYIDVANGLSVCSGLLEIRTSTTSDTDDTIKRIADSIGLAPDKWPSRE